MNGQAATLRGAIADRVDDYGRACAALSHTQPDTAAYRAAAADRRRQYADILRMLAELSEMAR